MRKLVVGKWYLVNKLWVKNVNNLRKTSTTSSAYSSTERLPSLQTYTTNGLQVLYRELDVLHYSTTIYTYLICKFTLLNKSFTYYPQSLLMSLLKEN